MGASLPILTFHTLDNRPSVISFPPQLFRRAMARLHDSGFRTLDLLEAVDYLQRETPFPERSFVITFDDGYRCTYDEGFPVLQRYGMCATIFLTVGEERKTDPAIQLPSLNDRPMLNWSEIREMQSAGVAFGAHTLTHPDLTLLPSEQIELEIRDSKQIIEDALGTPVNSFAYPYGRLDHRTLAVVRRYFACACSDRLGLVTRGSNPHAVERVDAYYLRTYRLFGLMSKRLFPWYIQARSIPRQIRRALHLSAG